MSDMIYRQALHERIKETVEEGIIYSGMTIAEFCHLLVDEVPSAERWIPCSERLPDYHDEVLVTSLGEVAIAWLYLDGNWRSNDMPEPMYKYIVAWMPLPEPWKGEK